MIRLEGITKSFGGLQVLRGIDLEIEKGEVVSIVGPRGAGKTTVLQRICLLRRHQNSPNQFRKHFHQNCFKLKKPIALTM